MADDNQKIIKDLEKSYKEEAKRSKERVKGLQIEQKMLQKLKNNGTDVPGLDQRLRDIQIEIAAERKRATDLLKFSGDLKKA